MTFLHVLTVRSWKNTHLKNQSSRAHKFKVSDRITDVRIDRQGKNNMAPDFNLDGIKIIVWSDYNKKRYVRIVNRQTKRKKSNI